MSARRVMRAGSALAAIAGVLLAANVALAQRDKASPEARQARALFDQGVALSDEGKWADALAVFQKSDQIVPSASAQFNIGATLRALGRYVEAKQVLEKVLANAATAKPAIKPALKKDVEKLLGEVKAKIVTVKLAVTPGTAKVEMDGKPISPLPDGRIEADPGSHVFVVKADGYDTTSVNKTLSSADVEVALTAPKTVVVERRVEAKPTPVYQRAWFWTVIGVAVAGGVAAGVIVAVQPKAAAPAGPPDGTVNRIVPAGATVRF